MTNGSSLKRKAILTEFNVGRRLKKKKKIYREKPENITQVHLKETRAAW